MSESAVLVNASRVANPAAMRRSIVRALAEEGWSSPGWFETTPGELGEGTARRAAATGVRVLFVCGGDGTVRAAAAALAGTETAIAVIPSGTGNLLALNLGLPTDIASAVRVATRGGRRRIDLGEVDGRPFAVAAGIGLDAQILAGTPHGAKHRLGWPAYVAAAVPHLGEPRFHAEVKLDGGRTIERDVRSVLVANVGRLPGGITLLPLAVPDDGLLDVALITPGRIRDWATLLTSLVGRHPKGGRIETFRVQRVEITTATPQPREVDGESLPLGARLVVQVRPQALTVCVRPALPRTRA
ncbi:MAG: diacylglycerol kinase family protein [Candidatus Dormiibacterota bacterium]